MPQPRPPQSPTPALTRIETFLRFFDDELASMKNELVPGRLLSSADEVPEVVAVLESLESALAEVVEALDVRSQVVDVRRRLRGSLHILWEDVIEMSPGRMKKQFGPQEVPEPWHHLQKRLLAAVERAITELS